MNDLSTPINHTPTPTPHTTGPTNSSLPAILCLHGGGSNSTVFKIQCRRLIWTLGTQFRFVFAESTTEGTPGHGMLPVFETCAPFYKWVSRKFVVGADKEVATVDDVKNIDGILRRVMTENGGVESFVGVLGFSQGARLAGGLLLRQQMAQREGRECWTRFKFGVMIGGPFPPVALVESGDEDEVEPERDFALLKTMPTVHAWGDGDHLRKGCMRFADVCEGDMCFRMEYEGGHHLPLKDKDARDLCDCIMAAWYAAGGRRMVGQEEKY